VRERAGKHADGEVGWRAAVSDGFDDARRHEGKRGEVSDVALLPSRVKGGPDRDRLALRFERFKPWRLSQRHNISGTFTLSLPYLPCDPSPWGADKLRRQEINMEQPGLDQRHRDKNGRIAKKHGNMLVNTLRNTYGSGFAPGIGGKTQLIDVLHNLDEPSLSKLIDDLSRNG
jgi:hypothetical protein